MEAIQIDYGTQARPYANHVWRWVIKKDGTPKDEVLSWARENLKNAPRERNEYKSAMRSDLSFEETMGVVCGGFYYLVERNDKEWEYVVEQEYID